MRETSRCLLAWVPPPSLHLPISPKQAQGNGICRTLRCNRNELIAGQVSNSGPDRVSRVGRVYIQSPIGLRFGVHGDGRGKEYFIGAVEAVAIPVLSTVAGSVSLF